MYIEYKATVWFRIPIETKEALDNCISMLKEGKTINEIYQEIDENDIGPCQTLYDTEEQLEVGVIGNNATIEVFNDHTAIPIWNNKHNADSNIIGPYLQAYILYLQENDLTDDSHTLTEKEAKNFLLSLMDQEDINDIVKRANLIYQKK